MGAGSLRPKILNTYSFHKLSQMAYSSISYVSRLLACLMHKSLLHFGEWGHIFNMFTLWLLDPNFRYFWSIHKFELELNNIEEDKFRGLDSNWISMMRFSKIGLWYFLCNKIYYPLQAILGLHHFKENVPKIQKARNKILGWEFWSKQ